MRHGRRPPWRTSCNARCRRFRINSKWLHVVGTCKFPHRKQEIGPCYKGVLGLVHGSVATSGSHLLRELTFVVEAAARLMKSLLREVCHKVNKSASRTLNEAGRYRTIRAPGNCPTSRRKENASQTRTTCTNVS